MKLARNGFCKLLAGLMAVGSLTVFVVSLLATVVLYAAGGYDSGAGVKDIYSNLIRPLLYQDVYAAADYYALAANPLTAQSAVLKDLESQYAPENSNFFFTVTDAETGEVLLSNYSDRYEPFLTLDCAVVTSGADTFFQEVMWDGDAIIFHPDSDTEAALDEQQVTWRSVQVNGFVRETVTRIHDKYTDQFWLASSLLRWRLTAAVLTGLSAVTALISLIFLLYGAGRRKDTEEISLSILDRIPADLAVLLWGGVVFGGVGLFFLTSEDHFFNVTFTKNTFWLAGLWAFVGAVLLVVLLTGLAVRLKVKGWWRNSLIWRVWNWFGELLHHPIRSLWWLLRQLPLVWKAAIAGIALAFVEFWCLLAFYHGNFFLMLLFNVVVALGLAYCCVCMVRLRSDCKAIAAGDTAHPVDTRYMVLDFKDHGEDLSSIREGISLAVEDRLRSERFKTELITNVSHDLKTPLTSIVNYVDLLSRLELPEQAEQAAEYVEVLRRQSARLKKLIEDLVEASKASTGGLPVTSQPIRLDELVGQVTAEYADRLNAAGLQAVTQLPDDALTVLADGRYLWRVMDNLLSNVCKYALPGTRVYITARTEGSKAVLAVKNISRDTLNISAEELMERFVRGDASRNTEGSGLGLSIAQSLCALMGGRLVLTVDGDLFKAEAELPLA